jgi:1,4-dihydroxy-2-naphthoyl-CoA hydrolase
MPATIKQDWRSTLCQEMNLLQEMNMTFDEHMGMTSTGNLHEAKIEIEDHHKNPTGNINGGAIISLADNLSTGCAGHHWSEKFKEQGFMVGVDLHAVMLSNQQGGTMIARSTPIRVGKRVTVIRTIVTGTDERILAEITTTHVPVKS